MRSRSVLAVVSFLFCVGLGVGASAQTDQPSGAAAPAAAGDKPAFKQEELDAIVAPIALYPDSLLSQVLMASTYPLEIVEADRWAKAHKDLKGDAAAKELESQSWDASVKSLVNFPDVLAMMSDKLDWTQKLGDAFIGQQKELMDTVQALRAKAKGEGNLKTTEQQKVDVQQQGSTQTIVIEPANPDVIYVPTYDPVVVYGTWAYPSYPPYPVYPPGYVAGGVLAFGAGVACGLAWGYAWGHCDWGRCDIDIDIDRNVERNRTIDRGKYTNKSGTWQHDPAHRKGVSYRDSGAAQKYGGRSAAQANQSREAFRGREQAGQSGLSQGGERTGERGGQRTGERTVEHAGDRGGGRDAGAPASRGGSGSGRSGALDGVQHGGGSERAASQRGNSSRGRSAGGGGGGGGRSRGGGGGRRH